MIDNTPNLGDVRNCTEESLELWNGDAWLLIQSPRLRVYNEGYEQGKRDAIAAVMQRIEALPRYEPQRYRLVRHDSTGYALRMSEVITAIKEDN